MNPSEKTPGVPKPTSEVPAELRTLHRVLLAVGLFFFVYLVVEGAILVPLLFARYGLH